MNIKMTSEIRSPQTSSASKPVGKQKKSGSEAKHTPNTDSFETSASRISGDAMLARLCQAMEELPKLTNMPWINTVPPKT